jgi:CRP-like cAMP-binding protein
LPNRQARDDVVGQVSGSPIASRLNLSQEHFSRILRALIESGLIGVEGRTIHIPAHLRATLS